MRAVTDPNIVLLYVDDPQGSVVFYSDLLGREPLEASRNFAMFEMASGVRLALWSRHHVEPKATVPGGQEIAFAVANEDEVQALHDAWFMNGMTIAQEPTRMDFGHTFVALDPDGHRLRVFAPAV
jgi:catechol 2,3-dioxygenase-like lactoylglutathione lyase family enzyme